jgi:hypothetical protein
MMLSRHFVHGRLFIGIGYEAIMSKAALGHFVSKSNTAFLHRFSDTLRTSRQRAAQFVSYVRKTELPIQRP